MDDSPNDIRVLAVDDDPDMLALLERWLERAGLVPLLAEDGAGALAVLARERADVVLTDLKMDGMDGLRLISEIHRAHPVMPVIMLSGEAGVDDAVRAAHLGINAFLTKPPSRDGVLDAIREAAAGGATGIASREAFTEGIVYRSARMAEVLERARLVSRVDSSVLITGATGTGKELVARAIHRSSARGERPFVSINCAAIPEQLLESELFGHEKGAFTGATNRHTGLFLAADGGTLFLDEIGDMPVGLQAKLLRVLQDFEVRPVGSVRTVPIDVRIIAATHVDLVEAVANGDFREDLFYRLSVVPIAIPTLDERREDIWPLVERQLIALAERHGDARKHFSPKARSLLVGASWPGNVRQLDNVVEQCWALSPAEIIGEELVAQALGDRPSGIVPLEEARREFELRYLTSVLRVTAGNVSGAARLAGRNRTEFYKLLGRHGLDAERFRESAEAEPKVGESG